MALTDETGRWLPRASLGALFDDVPDGRHIIYCGGGIAASAVALAMDRVGYDDLAVYVASLHEWAADERNPMTVE